MQSLFFYDLETSGFSPRHDRIMQFAGQRTDLELNPVGEPVNVMIQLPSDVLPDPGAILVTGITPQQTQQDGITEVEFLTYFHDEVATADTIFVGYNSVRFDDEFMRCLHYRNFYDPYEWQWKDGRSRWDLLDVVRMTRALRPDGIKWPVNEEGIAINKLEALTKENGLSHEHAHDALSDVMATIAVAKLIKNAQPKLFDWLLKARDKRIVKDTVEAGQSFVYSSGKYASEFQKTTAAFMICPHPQQQGALVYDCRHDPSEYVSLTPEQLVEKWRYNPDRTVKRLPVKVLQYNRCPAVAPLGVLDKASQERLSLSLETVQKNAGIIRRNPDFCENLHAALRLMDTERKQAYPKETTADGQIYDGFFPDGDKALSTRMRRADPATINADTYAYKDERLQALLPLYKARNFATSLSDEERLAWEAYRSDKLFSGGQNSQLAMYFDALQKLAAEPGAADNQFVLEELQLYGQAVMPSDVAA